MTVDPSTHIPRAWQAAVMEALLVYDRHGVLIESNPAAEALFGLAREQLVGTPAASPPWRVLREDGSPSRLEHPVALTLRTGIPVRNLELSIALAGGGRRWVRAGSTRLGDCAVAAFIDITVERQTIEELRTILDHVPARITSWNADCTNRFMNRASARLFGVAPAEALGRPAHELLQPERNREAAPFIAQVLGTGMGQVRNAVDRFPDGTVRHSQVTYVPMWRDGQVAGFHVLGSDVTELRSSYERIRELAQRLESIREEERRAMAMMIHEGIAQDLAAAQMNLETLRTRPHDPADVARVCAQLGEALRTCIEDLRRGAHELRPTTLQHLSLMEALEALAEEFAGQSGLRIAVRGGEPLPALDEGTRVLFYRTAQEALVNVASHARASSVEILVRRDDGCIHMDIEDDGIGIPVGALDNPGAFGLLGIRERFEARGGDMTVHRLRPVGTRLAVRLPLPPHAPSAEATVSQNYRP